MKLSKFTLSDNDEVFEGYTDGSLWNGWANVCFTRDQIRKFFDTTPYDYKFLEVGNPLNGEEYPLLVIFWDDKEEVFPSSPLPIDGDIVEGYFLDGLEFMEVEE
jgi:hypothetical protein